MKKESYGKDRIFKAGSDCANLEQLVDPTKFPQTITIEQIEQLGIVFGNGAGLLRKDGSFCMKYDIEKHRTKGSGNKVTGLTIRGYAQAPAQRSKIPKEVRDYYRGQPCPVTGIGVGVNEIDHKDGWTSQGTAITDFQPLSKSANDAKRQFCKQCRDTQQRYDARRKGFSVGWISGGSIRNQQEGCVGCYWYDVALFHKTVSQKFKKS